MFAAAVPTSVQVLEALSATLGKAAAPAPAATQPASTAPLAPQRVPEAAVAKPEKILRPGSLLDIRV